MRIVPVPYNAVDCCVSNEQRACVVYLIMAAVDAEWSDFDVDLYAVGDAHELDISDVRMLIEALSDEGHLVIVDWGRLVVRVRVLDPRL